MTAKVPDECSETELRDFAALVHAGGEVSPAGLEQRIAAARKLFFVHAGDCLVATGALKIPVSRYRASVFRRAKATCRPRDFAIELGWIFVMPSMRGKKISRKLVQAAVQQAPGEAIFATSRTDNQAMHASLEAFGFAKHGCDYLSADRSARIALFLLRAFSITST